MYKHLAKVRLNLSGIQTWHRFKSDAHNKLLQTANLIIILPIWAIHPRAAIVLFNPLCARNRGTIQDLLFLRLLKMNMHNLRGLINDAIVEKKDRGNNWDNARGLWMILIWLW